MARTRNSAKGDPEAPPQATARIARSVFRFGKGSPQDGYLGQFFGAHFSELWLIFRVGFAIMTVMHGIQKVFLFWNFPADQDLDPFVDIAGYVELIAAVLIGVGLYTRMAAGAPDAISATRRYSQRRRARLASSAWAAVRSQPRRRPSCTTGWPAT